MIYDLFAGLFLGISNIIPGLTGATMLVAFNRYETVIFSLRNIFKDFKKSVKKLYLIFIGYIFGIIAGVFVISKLLELILFVLVLMFSGLSLGSVSHKIKKVFNEGRRPFDLIIFLLTTLLMLGLMFFTQSISKSESFLLLLICGCLASFFMFCPGLSGGLLLVIFGLYEKIINAFKDLLLFKNAVSSILILLPFFIGLIIGSILAIIILEKFLKSYKHEFNVFVIAVLNLTPVVLIYKAVTIEPINNYYMPLFGVISFILSFYLIYVLGGTNEKN